jgi:hypothetical protein
MTTLKLSVNEWKSIREELHKEYPKSVFMLRNKMRAILGFTVREHSQWMDIKPRPGDEDDIWNRGYSELSICLDFYNEKKYTMFLLKYSEYINGQ